MKPSSGNPNSEVSPQMSSHEQAIFETVYRNRQGAFHHMAYMRMAKVLLALRALRLSGIGLEGMDVFDYGFGAGTFFRYCPASARLFGVEMDSENIREVRLMLEKRGRAAVLEAIQIESWRESPLLQREYDVFLCSHVLEHLPDPAGFLHVIRPCIRRGGSFLGLVPINERALNPHHVHSPNREMIEGWVDSAGLEMVSYEENDPWLYWFQPLFTKDAGLTHRAAQSVSLGLGAAATLMGEQAWFAVGKAFAAVSHSLPTQAVFLCREKSAARPLESRSCHGEVLSDVR